MTTKNFRYFCGKRKKNYIEIQHFIQIRVSFSHYSINSFSNLFIFTQLLESPKLSAIGLRRHLCGYRVGDKLKYGGLVNCKDVIFRCNYLVKKNLMKSLKLTHINCKSKYCIDIHCTLPHIFHRRALLDKDRIIYYVERAWKLIIIYTYLPDTFLVCCS